MKNSILVLIALFCFACDVDDDIMQPEECKQCRVVTYDGSGHVAGFEPYEELCGDELQEGKSWRVGLNRYVIECIN